MNRSRLTNTRKRLPAGHDKLLYLDANVFVYATLNREDIGDRARALLRRVQEGKSQAASSTLTFDELVWAVKRHRSIEDAANAGEAFIGMPGLELIEVSGTLISAALELIRRYKFDPRDSIHAACALFRNAEAIISDDEHFDRLREIQRRPI